MKCQMKWNRDELIGIEKITQTLMSEDRLQDDRSPSRVYNSPMTASAQCSGMVKKTDWMSGTNREGAETSLPLYKPTAPCTSVAFQSTLVQTERCWETLKERQQRWSKGNASTWIMTEQAGTLWPENCLQFGIFKIYLIKGDTTSLKSVFLERPKCLISGVMLNMVCHKELFSTFKYLSFTD